MATRTFGIIQDENLNINHRGTSFGRDTNVSRIKKARELGGSKPLTNITNSGKPSAQNVSKKNVTKKLNVVEDQNRLNRRLDYFNLQTGGLIQDENSIAKHDGGIGHSRRKRTSVVKKSTTQKKAALSGRKALTNITNSKKSDPRALKKNHPKKLEDIAEEGRLHNHQECLNAQSCGMDTQWFMKTIGFDEEYLREIANPGGVFTVSRQAKDPAASPPRYMEYEELPVFLNEAETPPRSKMPDQIQYPSPRAYLSSPILSLLNSP